jgi:hypothetical protein
MSDLGQTEVAVAVARMAALELVYEVEQTMKWLDSFGPQLDPPTRDDVARLEEVMAHRAEQVKASIGALRIAVDVAMDLELLMHRRRAQP